jgi:hypothetical protein
MHEHSNINFILTDLKWHDIANEGMGDIEYIVDIEHG